ncbi:MULTISPECIES: MBL fold metallo-hydrolase [Vibrio]|uniref:MBL fold metallo-hydrolase n=1 Tax=Vibrio TaxID=662 RepID=UPI002074FD66|nr:MULTISPECIES: MBL fold metallo-hydrolase [Vibrio]USD34048.1 MBL fold metallo-hydrolase [Vibrio sp. SCSIO 43186]USD47118.1 MBL fold metallo-hydrolase [Vibrio sp. SCSIO 43145]USD71172.1 MBL fold metallo-hydrolase [Vibrio sp. SCSIO 43139]USD96024.1 MBL fold metallo-hydrolase [Vibrio coralliilyticus]
MKKLTLLAASMLIATHTYAAEQSNLTFDVYSADQNSFYVNSTLIVGDTEVMVVDTGFTKADALRIAAKVLDAGKPLKTIFISQADPDYYFGAEVLHELFPEAQIITTPAVRKVIEEKLPTKLKVWAPRMGANAPVKPYIPDAYTASNLTIDGHTIEIHGNDGDIAHRPYLWIPSEKAVLGNVSIYGTNLHLWMADAQSDDSQALWSKQLNEIQSLKPEIVVPGHMLSGTKLDVNSIQYSQQYLKDFKQAKQTTENSEQLIEKMNEKYAEAALPVALSIGAKVHKGEMEW